MLRTCSCGAQPKIICDDEIVPGQECWAIFCPSCLKADTHWQQDFEKAEELWNAGKVKGNRGGQASDQEATRH